MKKLILPALRGVMGDWVYYTCLVSLKDLSERVNFADDIHKNEKLSTMIQRQLKGPRAKSVAEYLKNQPERLFNSLVVATYGGTPQWSPLTAVNSENEIDFISEVDNEMVSSVGFLILSGEENLFALDGQHRLAGIKMAIKDGVDDDPYDEVSVILVSHNKDAKGLERTRRLFTTLNKTAKPVTKGDIIALDEDDVMALSTRWLIEETEILGGDRVAFVQANNVPTNNKTSLTTIGNLYDLLTILFTQVECDIKATKTKLTKIRPEPEILKKYFDFSLRFFKLLGDNFEEIDEFFKAKKTTNVVEKYRNSDDGGSVLFRPVGLEVFTRVIVKLTKEMSLEDAIAQTAKLPTKLDQAPFKKLMWDDNSKRMSNSHKATVREVLLHMLGGRSKYSYTTLLEKYRRDIGDDDATLPSQV